jgi:hypothetical protein
VLARDFSSGAHAVRSSTTVANQIEVKIRNSEPAAAMPSRYFDRAQEHFVFQKSIRARTDANAPVVAIKNSQGIRT